MATSFGTGDIVYYYGTGAKYKILYIHRGRAFAEPVGGGDAVVLPIANIKRVPDFFEVGKTYRYGIGREITFDCHYVGSIGATNDGRRYAAGQKMLADRAYSTTLISLDDWEEV